MPVVLREPPHVNSADGIRVPYRCGHASGFRYGVVPEDVASALPRWLAQGRVEEGVALKDDAVFRCGRWLVKFTPGSRKLKDLLRPASSIRSADLHVRLRPVKTPAPLVALEVRRGLFLERGLLVEEFVEGPSLGEAFRRNARASGALAHFVATLHAHGVFHGDLHPENAIWNGSAWVLIDVASLRHPLRRLSRRQLALEQWVQFAYRLGPEPPLEACFARYVELAGLSWDAPKLWAEVVRRAEVITSRRQKSFDERAGVGNSGDDL